MPIQLYSASFGHDTGTTSKVDITACFDILVHFLPHVNCRPTVVL